LQPEFAQLTYKVWEVLRDEVLNAQAAEMKAWART